MTPARGAPPRAFEATAPILAGIGTALDDRLDHTWMFATNDLHAWASTGTAETPAFSFAELARAAQLDAEPRRRPRARPRRPAAKPRLRPPIASDDVARNLAAMAPPDVGRSRSSLLGFREAEAVPWTARSRARQLVRDGDRALRVGERRRAHELYRRAAGLGSRQAHERLEELERG
jgi:hypothetical protein